MTKTRRQKRKQTAGRIIVDPNVIINRIRDEYLPGNRRARLLHFSGHSDRWLKSKDELWNTDDLDYYVNVDCGRDPTKSNDCTGRDFSWVNDIRLEFDPPIIDLGNGTKGPDPRYIGPTATNAQLLAKFPFPGPPRKAGEAAPEPDQRPVTPPIRPQPQPRPQPAPAPAPQPRPQAAPPPPRHSASQQSAREQSAREQADREASRQKYARWKAAQEAAQEADQEAAREKAAREKYAEEAAHHSRMKAARQEAARKRAAEEEAEAALREAERKKAAAEEAAQIRANREKAKKKADRRKAEEKERIQKVNAYNKAVRLKGSDAISSAMDIDSVSKRDIKQKANQYYLEKYPSLRSNFLTDPDYYGPIIEQILNGDPSNYEKLFKELSNYNSPAVLRRFRFGSSRGRLLSLPTRRARRFSSSKKRRYSRRQRA